MNRRTVAWALAFQAAAVLVALGWFPGASAAAQGPRIGLTVALGMLGTLLLAGAFAGELRARTDRLDSKGGCPVGATCRCGHFNFKPRAKCKSCGLPTTYTAPATAKTQ